MSVGDGRRLGGVVPGVGRSGGSVGDGGDGGGWWGGGRWWWGVLLLVVLGVGGWLEYGSDVRSWVGERTGSEPSGTTLVEGRVPEPVERFDPLVTPSASGVDLVRLREVVGSLEDPVGCPPTGTVGSLDDVVEVLRLVDGCLVLEYVVLEGRSVEEVADGYAPDSGVLAVGRPLRVAADNSHLGDPEAGNQWHLDKLGAESLWAGWPPGAEVTVAVIDTGVDGAHHDLDDNLVVWGDDAHREDRVGHGTHVAGIIAAEAGNGVGGAGVAPDASVVSIRLRLLVPEPYEETAPDQTLFRTLAAAVAEARRSGARVVNMSIHMVDDQNKRADSLPAWCANASPQTCGDPAAWQIRTAQAEGIIFVASSGNCGQKAVANCKTADQIQWPAAYEGVIGVASTDNRDQRSWFSTAAAHVDIAAPGQDILSTLPRNSGAFGVFRWNPERTDQKSGTSMATPVVTAVIAHLLARFPHATYTQITNSLYKTADMPWLYQSTPQRRTDEFGWGIIHPLNAIQHLNNTLNPPPPTPTTAAPTTTTPPTPTTAAPTTTTPPTPTTAAPPATTTSTTLPTSGGYLWVAAGESHSCALRADYNSIECWGGNARGQLDAPAGRFNAVAAGGSFSCGLSDGGAVRCWGKTIPTEVEGEYDPWEEMESPGGRFVALQGGLLHACGIRADGTIHCWGGSYYGQLEFPEGTFTSLSAGLFHSCGIRTDGTVSCWGNNLLGSYFNEEKVVDAPEGEFVAVAAGDSHSCGIRTDGTVVCWGDATAKRLQPPDGRFVAVAAGDDYSCGIRTDGTVVCWGDAAYGQLDAPEGRFGAIATGNHHSCGIRTDGAVICWGDNRFGQTTGPDGLAGGMATAAGTFPGPGDWYIGSGYPGGEHEWVIPEKWSECTIWAGDGSIWVDGVEATRSAFGSSSVFDVSTGTRVRVNLVDYRLEIDCQLSQPDTPDVGSLPESAKDIGRFYSERYSAEIAQLGLVYDGRISRSGETRSYVFEAPSGGGWERIDTVGPTDVTIDVYELADTSREYLVESDDDSADRSNAVIQVQLDPGWYRVDVHGYQTTTGDYSLRIGKTRDPLEGKFVSVVASPTSETAAFEARDDLEREYGLQFGILLSNDYRSLKAGYWVVYLGPFDTAKESQNACWWDLNMEKASLCYGRRLSQNPDDREVSYAPVDDR